MSTIINQVNNLLVLHQEIIRFRRTSERIHIITTTFLSYQKPVTWHVTKTSSNMDTLLKDGSGGESAIMIVFNFVV